MVSIKKLNKIDRVFSSGKNLKLMTHVVGGYPGFNVNEDLVELMVERGVDMVEIQVPFSDPLADGPVIARANQAALDVGVTPERCFRLAERLSGRVGIPLLVMTYVNIPYSMGYEVFLCRCSESGISGVIVPDLPFEEASLFFDIARRYGVYFVPVVSPGMEEVRLEEVVGLARGFIYATLRVGITGVKERVEPQGLEFLEILRRCTSLPVMGGFGISSAGMVRRLEGLVDGVVIGSHIINLYDIGGMEAVGEFIFKTKYNFLPRTNTDKHG
jgi:tryptophan synthase alpha chain